MNSKSPKTYLTSKHLAPKRAVFKDLLSHDEYRQCPLDRDHKKMIAIAVSKEFASFDAVLMRFRVCVAYALYYRNITGDISVPTNDHLFAQYAFRFPKELSHSTGVVDIPQMRLLMNVLEDILQVLKIAKKHARFPKNALEELEIEKTYFSHTDVKNKEFKDVCTSWGFQIPVTAHSLYPRVTNISNQPSLEAKIRHVSESLQALMESIEYHFELEQKKNA